MKWVVSGVAGFIGSNIVKRLVAENEEVVGVDDLSQGTVEAFDDFKDGFRFMEADIRDPVAMRVAVEGADCVLHQAALGSVPRSVKDPAETNDVNVNGTVNVLLAARDAGVGTVVLASSSSVYGNTEVNPRCEAIVPAPVSPYAVSKLACEHYANVFARLYGMKVFCLRYFNVFGPRQRPTGPYAAVIPKFITAAMKGDAANIYGDGKQTRDFTYVDDVVRANLAAARFAPPSPRSKRPILAGHAVVMNVGAGVGRSLLDVRAMIAGIVGFDREPVYLAEREGDVRHAVADPAMMKWYLNFVPGEGGPFEKHLEETVEWYARHQSSASS